MYHWVGCSPEPLVFLLLEDLLRVGGCLPRGKSARPAPHGFGLGAAWLHTHSACAAGGVAANEDSVRLRAPASRLCQHLRMHRTLGSKMPTVMLKTAQCLVDQQMGI